jgi:AcrR family transcriptional regulator
MLAAMVEEVSGRGTANVTVAHVVARSGVSRRTFYEQFADREECFLGAFDEVLARLEAVVVPAYEEGCTQRASWRAGVRAGLVALLGFLECDPACASAPDARAAMSLRCNAVAC